MTNFCVRSDLTDIMVAKAVAAQRGQESVGEAQVRITARHRGPRSHRLGRARPAPAPIGIECEGT